MKMHGVCERLFLATLVAGALAAGGCGESTSLFSPSFINFARGGVIPLTPAPASSFVLVRTVNRTQNPIEFIVTVEREAVTDADVDGWDQADEQTDFTAQLEAETFRLQTFSGGLTNEVGILLDCPIVRVGLGENLNFPTEEPGLFIGTTEGQLVQGFGVPGGVFPLDARAGNFTCGDTLVFEAATALGVPGNVRVTTFVLSAADQPPIVSGPDTFNNARALLERQYVEEE